MFVYIFVWCLRWRNKR